jgi:WD40 repeat protein
LHNAITIDPGGNYLAVRTDNSTLPGFISVREPVSGDEVWKSKFERPVLGIAFSADGKRLAVSTRGYCQVWSIAEKQELVRIHGGFNSGGPLAFSPDGQYLAVVSDNRLSIWALLLDQRQQRMLPGDETIQIAHPGTPYAVSFSPDGAYVASTSLWEIATGEEIARFPLPDRLVDLAFSPDGQYLVARGRDNTAKLWRLWPDDLIKEACTRLSRNLTPHEWRTYLGDAPYQRTCNNLP